MPAWLVIEEGADLRRTIPIESDTVLIGRDPSCDVVIDHRLVSRQHARIWREGKRYRVEDLGSRNGTRLNGERLDPEKGETGAEGQPLSDGDEITIARVIVLGFNDPDVTPLEIVEAGGAAGLRLDEARRDVWIAGRKLAPPLTPGQYSLLRLLLARAGAVCSRDEIVAAVWPKGAAGVSDDAVDGIVKRLRARLKEIVPDSDLIQSVRGHGLKLAWEDSRRKSGDLTPAPSPVRRRS